jgi:hypothetical protein
MPTYLDAPLHSLVVPTSTVRLVRCLRFAAGEFAHSLPLWSARFHTSCRAARCDHECVSYGRTYSSNDRSRASKDRLLRRFYDLLQGEFAPDFHQH